MDEETAGFDSGVRIEAQLADGDDPASRVRVGWSNSVNLSDEWQLRGVLLSGHQFGPESEDGFFLQTRAQVSRAINGSVRLALDYYADFNEVADMGSFGDQEHQLGPVVKFDVTDRLGGMLGVLRGISRSAPDFEYQLFFSYSL